jgi:hypothetical protein
MLARGRYRVKALVNRVASHITTLPLRESEFRSQTLLSTDELAEAMTNADAALQLAVDQGWLLVEGGHSFCLTDAGRLTAKD